MAKRTYDAKKNAAAGERSREYSRRQTRRESASVRDIGKIPPVKRKKVRAACERDFEKFCLQFFPHTFAIPFSSDHRRVIARIETTVLDGGQFSIAMPRGSGKTTLCEIACIWAVLYGHRKFVCLIGAEATSAEEMLASIRMELETNELLQESFPEVCYPIEKLEGVNQRKLTHKGALIRTRLSKTIIILPTIEGSQASAAIIKVAGITGRIRGMKYKRPDGKSVRPDLVIVDDPQTDESARSPTQCQKRESVLAGAVLGLAGPGKKIAAIMPCTVIVPDDMADRLLDRQKHPRWNGERTKLVNKLPEKGSDCEQYWTRYADMVGDSFRTHGDGRDATDFYRANREIMDSGVEVAWKERFKPDELSAIQHAMNLKFQDEVAFFAEYQNEPLALPIDGDLVEILTADEIAAKLSGLPRGLVPQQCNQLTAFIDVQMHVLFWLVCGWTERFDGFVLDYGTWPDQKAQHFTKLNLRKTLTAATEKAGLESSIYAGLESLTSQLLGREWKRDDGASMRIERCCIDANWGQSTDLVYDFCRRCLYPSVVMPSHGKFVGASSKPLNERAMKPGERVGLNWFVRKGDRPVRHVVYDTNFWKSFMHGRLAVPMGDAGCLSLFGDDSLTHGLLSEHLTAEYRVRVEVKSSGRSVDEWKVKPDRPDNDWLDCLTGCTMAASVQGLALDKMTARAGVAKQKRKVRLSELQGTRRAGR